MFYQHPLSLTVHSVAHSVQAHMLVGTAAGCDKRHWSVKIMNPYNNLQ